PHDAANADVIINPIRVYRGRLSAPTVRIAAIDDAGSSPKTYNNLNTMSFKSSSDVYVFYLHLLPDGRYSTSRCDGTHLLGGSLSSEEQAQLGSGQIPRGQ